MQGTRLIVKMSVLAAITAFVFALTGLAISWSINAMGKAGREVAVDATRISGDVLPLVVSLKNMPFDVV